MAFLENLKGHVALITGGSRGIGKAIALQYAKDGADICVVARNKDLLEEVVAECKQFNVRAISVVADCEQLNELKNAVDTCVEQLGGLSILVNNAGIFTKYSDSLEKWIECVNVNLISLMALTHHSIPHLIAHPAHRSAIIQICSVAGRISFPQCAPYNASKFGVLGFSNSLYEEVREHGVKVCTILPGMVNTDMGTQGSIYVPELMIQPEELAVTASFVARYPATGCPTEIQIRPQKNPRKDAVKQILGSGN